MSQRSAPSRSAASTPQRFRSATTKDEEMKALDESVTRAIAVGLKVAASVRLKEIAKASGNAHETVNPSHKLREYKRRHVGTEQQNQARAPEVIKVGRAGSLPAVTVKPRKLRTRGAPIKASPPTTKIKKSNVKPIQEGRRPTASNGTIPAATAAIVVKNEK